jgi:hypothetical protein
MAKWQPDNKRLNFAIQSQKDIEKAVQEAERSLYGFAIDWAVGNIEVDGNRITYTSSNLSKVQALSRALAQQWESLKSSLIRAMLTIGEKLLGLNLEYFKAISSDTGSIEADARRNALLRWGYDTATGQAVAGGYLAGVFDSVEIGQKVGRLMNRAIAGQMKLTDFRKIFKNVFVSGVRPGLILSQFRRFSHDLFITLDRAAQREYALKLGLKYAVYSGTIIETSRPFCEERVNRCFTTGEIQSWAEIDFQGKPPIYDPFIDCGGYNCRHHLSFVSDELGKLLRTKQRTS